MDAARVLDGGRPASIVRATNARSKAREGGVVIRICLWDVHWWFECIGEPIYIVPGARDGRGRARDLGRKGQVALGIISEVNDNDIVVNCEDEIMATAFLKAHEGAVVLGARIPLTLMQDNQPKGETTMTDDNDDNEAATLVKILRLFAALEDDEARARVLAYLNAKFPARSK